MANIRAFWFDGREVSLDNFEAFYYITIQNADTPEYKVWAAKAKKYGYTVPEGEGCWYFHEFARKWVKIDESNFWNVIESKRRTLSEYERNHVWKTWLA